MEQYKSEQEKFWAGHFGDEYLNRNRDEDLIAAKTALFSEILKSIPSSVSSIIEFGPNIGLNLIALHRLLPSCDLSGVEINEKAVDYLKELPFLSSVHHQSIIHFKPSTTYDLVMTVGVLIHINPELLPDVYSKIYESSKKYILIAEYYNPSPVELNYRGHTGKLFKRDFSGEMMDKYQDLNLIDYGFVYHRDSHFPLDDISWFLLSKRE